MFDYSRQQLLPYNLCANLDFNILIHFQITNNIKKKTLLENLYGEGAKKGH